MPGRTITLTEPLDRFVEESVASGRYGDASGVVAEALALLEARDRSGPHRSGRLREAVRIGFEDLDQGRSKLVPDDGLEAYVAELGELATGGAGRSSRR